jgi:hypothetical protein
VAKGLVGITAEKGRREYVPSPRESVCQWYWTAWSPILNIRGASAIADRMRSG